MRYTLNYEKKIKDYIVQNNLHYSYYIETFGCALNENDSMKYQGIFEEMGMTETADEKNANIILFNTCAIRENAEKKLYGRLGRIKKYKASGRKICVCVVGCMTEQKHVREKIRTSYSFADIVTGTKEMQFVAKYIYDIMFQGLKVENMIEEQTVISKDEVYECIPIKQKEKTMATVSIIYGCNNFCSYCIVPYVRGRERSRKPQDILQEIEELASNGYTDVMLLGQNVNSYGNDFLGELKEYNFVSLLKDIENIPGILSIKYISPHPKDFSEELIKHIATSLKVSKQIHLPLQSGSSKVLKLMNRKYTKEQYLNLVEKIKQKVPGVSFSTDIIVGFPQETEEDYLDTLDVVKKVQFDMIYMFCYSPRKGTVAANMEGQVDESVKVDRLQRLKRTYEQILDNMNDEMVGKTMQVYVVGISKNNSNMLECRSDTNKVVIIERDDMLIGKHVSVKIISNNKWYLTGKKI